MTFLEIKSIIKRFGELVALDGIDLAVRAGSRTAIVGPSGSGKTTLLRIIAGFDDPDTGRIVIDGRLMADGPRGVPAHRRSVGIVAQDGALFPHLSVAENVGFGLARDEPNRVSRIAALMQMVGLEGIEPQRRPDELSGGQQQRVALARALAREPRLMLLDEPFAALDTGLRASTRRAVSGLLEDAGITTILVTHDQAEALSFADQLAVMKEGRLVQVGPPRDLYLRPRDAMVAEFLGEAIFLTADVAEGRARCILGLLAADDPMSRGRRQIMLRPEQVAMAIFSSTGTDPRPDMPLGEVIEIDFGGSLCTVGVRMSGDGTAAPTILRLRQPGFALPALGDKVIISVAGTAHVLPA
jgi:iron(III) transport system ATP-binding protein